MPLARAKPSAAGMPLLGHAHDHVGVDRRLLGELLAHAHPGLVHVLAVERAVGSGEVDELEEAEVGLDRRRRSNGRTERHPVASMMTISPGSTSRTKWAPTTSSAGVSEASTQPLSSLPRQSGQKPFGIAGADDVAFVHEHEREGALEAGQHLGERPLERPTVGRRLGVEGQLARRCSSATRSLSLVTAPGSMPTSAASFSVLTRLPLWPSAKECSPTLR